MSDLESLILYWISFGYNLDWLCFVTQLADVGIRPLNGGLGCNMLGQFSRCRDLYVALHYILVKKKKHLQYIIGTQVHAPFCKPLCSSNVGVASMPTYPTINGQTFLDQV